MLERYFLPWCYGWLAYYQWSVVHRKYKLYESLVARGIQPMAWPVFCAGVAKYLLIACMSLFMGLALLVSRRPTHLPKILSHILVPMAMSYYFLLYPTVDHLPIQLRTSLLPEEWQFPAAVAAIVLGIIGSSIALWGLFYLRRSFAILVAVRKVVSGGPYTYVRHPMYLGYSVELTGLVLASFCPGMIMLALGFVFLMVTRAKMEEERLLEASPEYGEQMKRTGFILPRFWR
jgi:protein-S-isoprenylcysteine O-methyltransferase Ste14